MAESSVATAFTRAAKKKKKTSDSPAQVQYKYSLYIKTQTGKRKQFLPSVNRLNESVSPVWAQRR